MKKVLVLILATVFLFALAGCNSGKPQATPTPEPTATVAPTEEPTAEPTAAPTPTEEPTPEPIAYTFDSESGMYADEFISFTIPEGYSLATDDTGDTGYDVYISFGMDNAPDGFASNLIVMVYDEDVEEGGYASITEDQFTQLQLSVYEQMGIEAKIDPVEFEHLNGDNYEGLRFEFTLELMGVNCRQIVWVINTNEGKTISLTYSFTDEEIDACHASVDSIEILN